ncbi:hypothetical protein JTE90_003649 [Oedothorax gibbosus]|uniref:Uncharacterized protein n=1 Tax=Oedothorax gibbosus TaxID=931172 RepID=A0AAV6TCX5_9ARAC|nr:hypothetical protein JTE90_003649 [Oedothorax gibbosus]
MGLPRGVVWPWPYFPSQSGFYLKYADSRGPKGQKRTAPKKLIKTQKRRAPKNEISGKTTIFPRIWEKSFPPSKKAGDYPKGGSGRHRWHPAKKLLKNQDEPKAGFTENTTRETETQNDPFKTKIEKFKHDVLKKPEPKTKKNFPNAKEHPNETWISLEKQKSTSMTLCTKTPMKNKNPPQFNRRRVGRL